MSKVNFVGEFRAFMEFAKENKVYSRERVLWMALFMIANGKAEMDMQTGEHEWPDDFFFVSNSELIFNTGMDKKGIEEARNRLKQRGLIDFVAGERRKCDPKYKLVYFTSPKAPQHLSKGSPKAPQHLSKGSPKAPQHLSNGSPKAPQHLSNGSPKAPQHLSNGSPSNDVNININLNEGINVFKKRFGINDNYRQSTPARRATAGRLLDILTEQRPDVVVPIPNAFDLIERALVYQLTPYMVYRLAMESRDFIGFMEAMEEPPAWAKEQALAERRALDGSDQLG